VVKQFIDLGVAAPPPGFRESSLRSRPYGFNPITRTLGKIRESVVFVPLATGKGERSVASVWRTFFAEQSDKSITRNKELYLALCPLMGIFQLSDPYHLLHRLSHGAIFFSAPRLPGFTA